MKNMCRFVTTLLCLGCNIYCYGGPISYMLQDKEHAMTLLFILIALFVKLQIIFLLQVYKKRDFLIFKRFLKYKIRLGTFLFLSLFCGTLFYFRIDIPILRLLNLLAIFYIIYFISWNIFKQIKYCK